MPCNAWYIFLSGKYRLMLIVVILCLFVNPAQAKTYYFSSSSGNDNYSAAQAQSQSTPWRSISKLNSIFSTLIAGDSLLLKRGDIFYGAIVASASGAFKKHIVIAAWGNGNNPVITGFTTVSTWTSTGNGIYQATLSGSANLNAVTINNQLQQIGRYPNPGAANGGYLTYETFTDTVSITDTALTNAINWTGAEVVIRKKLWVLDRCKITNHTGNTIFYSNPGGSDYDGTNNYGYFIQNDIRTLDQFGEWYYNPSARQLSIYFGTAQPSAYQVRAATVDALVYINNRKYITIANISFEGANQYGVYGRIGDYINVQQCSFNNIGGMAVYMESVSDIMVENVIATNILSNALRFNCGNDSVITVRNCRINKTGIIRGMGFNGGNSYKAISADLAKNLLIENNRVDTTGYVGIEFDGSNVLVRNNVVNYFCFVKDDAGGIYSWIPQGDQDFYYENRVVRDNVVMNGIGAPEGRSSSNPFVSGIYLDGQIMNVEVLNNTVFNVGKNGIHSNNPNNITISGNTVFNTLNAVSFMRWSWGNISNLKIKNNIFYPKLPTQRNLYYTNAALNDPVPTSLQSAVQSLGYLDSNYYSSSNETGFNYEVYATAGGSLVPVSAQSLEGWRLFSGNDNHSKRPFREAPEYSIKSLLSGNTVSYGAFNNNINGVTAFSSNATINWDNTNQIAGGSLRLDIINPSPNRFVLLYGSVGAVSSAKKYVLRFKTKGTTPYGIVKAYLRKTASPYTGLISSQLHVYDTLVKAHEFVFAAPVSESAASFVIEIELNSGTTYLDDIEFYEADADVYSKDDYLRFEYNDSSTYKTVNLGANYIDVDGTYYQGSVVLKPYSSIVLVKDTSVLRAPLAAQVSFSPILCYGEVSQVTVRATGGIPPYTGTGTFNVAAGTYTYTVKDLRGVAVSASVTITQPSAPLTANATSGTISIYGGSTWVNVTASGGTPVYSGAGIYNNVIAGTYNYDIKDANGCKTTVSVVISQPALLRAQVSAVPVSCYGGTTAVTVRATGGIPPYTGTGTFSVPAGNYSYTVRDAAGASSTSTITITQPLAPLRATAVAGTITSYGGSTSVTVSATGGTAPYTGTGVVNNVVAGTYSYTVRDSRGCSTIVTVTVTQPPPYLTAGNLSLSIPCFDGNAVASVVAAGGYTPYTGTGNFNVNAGKGALKIEFPMVMNDFYTLLYFTIGPVSASKKYMLRFSTYGTTANGTVRAAIRQTYSPWNLLSPRQVASYGVGRKDHEFVFDAPVADAAASFLIDFNQNSGTSYVDNIAFFELGSQGNIIGNNLYASGDFEQGVNNIFVYSSNNNQQVTWDTTRKIGRSWYFPVTDASGSTAVATVTTSQPAVPLIVSVSAPAIPSTGSTTTVTVTASGGTAPYNGTGTYNNVRAGTYTYTVTDANGCTASKTVTIVQSSSKPTLPVPVAATAVKTKIQVAPNPSPGSFTLYPDQQGSGTAEVFLYAADGRLIERHHLLFPQRLVFGESLAAGFYLLTVVQGERVQTLRLIKTR